MSLETEFKLESDGDSQKLLSPGVGWFTLSRQAGEVLSAGEKAGVLTTLNRATELIVPDGVMGRIISEQPELVRTSVDVRTVLYELEPVSGDSQSASKPDSTTSTEVIGLVLAVPQSGRLYRSRAPGEAPLINVGAEVAEGTAVGLIEIMKTFSHVLYHAKGVLPERARVVEIFVEDGTDVRRGDPLLRVEPI